MRKIKGEMADKKIVLTTEEADALAYLLGLVFMGARSPVRGQLSDYEFGKLKRVQNKLKKV